MCTAVSYKIKRLTMAFLGKLGTRLQTTVFMLSCMSAIAVDSSIRLFGGSSDKEGAVQVNVTDEWRNICNDGWDALDALVTCRQLGFTEGYALLWYDTMNIHGTTEAPKNWLDTEGNEFACNGNEKTLLSCKHTKSSTYCPQRAGVACGVTEVKYNDILAEDWGNHDVTYEVITSSDRSGGRVLAKHAYNFQGIYLTGGVCDMNQRMAMLICSEQGYSNGGQVLKVPSLDGLPMLVSTVSCGWNNRDSGWCERTYTSTGVCTDGIQYNGVQCYTTLAPSVTGALVFAALASLIILIAGACAVRWILKDRKPSHVPLNIDVNEPDDV
ncbi:scavenger receptor cysteine-rich type 1 protein M130-like [Strongylocentrotus purpuratus]|uniref:SRCR domain-containing protein n=1 Tax=Strongylocentrotus purpuratus TaxID=7668 RepID=A0A7M7HEL9_STRPU|nr:scavenger receptor cysteine-rich type 1 protein M130-like [Strongylocentrotus purpuratus]